MEEVVREKSNLLAVSAIVTDGKGNILLKKRMKEPDAGSWELFATYPYLDEPLEEAVQRVLREKGGIKEIESIEFSSRYYDRPGRHPGKACIPLIFIAQIAPGFESPDTAWFSRVDLAEIPVALDNRQTLADLGFV
jgi:ADP-ribose pyrophosphatase YjhB (NUDIX family)